MNNVLIWQTGFLIGSIFGYLMGRGHKDNE